MAVVESHPCRHATPGTPLPECVALVLQGGGASGSFQAGVVEELALIGVEVSWVVGISVGAVNAALFAGNPPERRLDAFQSFWNGVSTALPSFSLPMSERMRELSHQWAASAAVMNGVSGFFTRRPLLPFFAMPGTHEALSFYDTKPLAAMLDRLVDWDLLNQGPVRLSVGVVDVESGNFHYFDTRETRIDARHIMASGALPPGLPPVEIDGRCYWDGGLVSNTPLTHVLDHQDAPMLVFQIDLFPAIGAIPRTMLEVMTREKEIRYSSRTGAVSDERMRRRRARQMVRRLLDKLPLALADDPDVQAVRALVSEHPVSLVHIIYGANSWEGAARECEFSTHMMHEHWQAGRNAIAETMANAQIIAHNILDGDTTAFNLSRR